LRDEYHHEKVISRISRFSLEQKYKSMGIDTIDVTQILATAIENLIVRPTTYHALVESFENFSVDEIPITNKEMDGLQLKEIPFHKDAILMMVRRGNNFYIPHGETYFKLGDVLHVFGTDTAMEDTKRKLGA
jgi:Trk K+ transport system NAD-binding subunit